MGNYQSGQPLVFCLGLLLCSFLAACAVEYGDAGSVSSRGAAETQSSETHSRASLRDSVHQTFIGEIGVKEEGGDNRGERIQEYLAVTGLDAGYAWCAAFVAWGFTEHEVDNPKSAWSPDWFPVSHTIYQRGTVEGNFGKEGDVIGIYFQSKERIAHVGVIDTVTASYVITIEGNTNDSGSREGDRVMRKRRVKRQIYKVSSWISD